MAIQNYSGKAYFDPNTGMLMGTDSSGQYLPLYQAGPGAQIPTVGGTGLSPMLEYSGDPYVDPNTGATTYGAPTTYNSGDALPSNSGLAFAHDLTSAGIDPSQYSPFSYNPSFDKMAALHNNFLADVGPMLMVAGPVAGMAGAFGAVGAGAGATAGDAGLSGSALSDSIASEMGGGVGAEAGTYGSLDGAGGAMTGDYAGLDSAGSGIPEAASTAPSTAGPLAGTAGDGAPLLNTASNLPGNALGPDGLGQAGYDAATAGASAGSGTVGSAIANALGLDQNGIMGKLVSGITAGDLFRGGVSLTSAISNYLQNQKNAQAYQTMLGNQQAHQALIDNPGTGNYKAIPLPSGEADMSNVPYSDWVNYGKKPQKSFFKYARGGQSMGPLSMGMHDSSTMHPYVQGPGGGQDDEVDARLSPKEYVLDSELVSMLGDGNPDEGARKLDQFRERVRAHKRAAPLTAIPPKAKPIERYMGAMR